MIDRSINLVNLDMKYVRGLYRVRRAIGQSNLLLINDLPHAIVRAIESIMVHRYWLEHYILHHPEFILAL
ncbi:MAG: hypothetical protein RMJ31_03910 [Nitrososphaerota archaeon]|nr:hypothetical protein [Nitrososphaerota archaeon]